MLIFATVIVLIAPWLHIRADQRLELFLLPDIPFPHSCLSKSWFGVRCPGCGLTRSLISFSQLHFSESLRYHQLGWLFAVSILLQIPFRTWALVKQLAYPL